MEIETGLNSQSFFLSNKNAFIYRFADTGFKNKWTGFWSNGKKFVEFIAFKANNEFLSEQNCHKFEYDYVKGIHSHKLLDGTEIKQAVWTPKNKPFFVAELSSEKKIRVELLLAANIRKIDENSHKHKYMIKEENGIEISNGLGQLSVSALRGKFSFEKKPEYKTHKPQGEIQNYFVPGVIRLKGKNIAVQFSAGKKQSLNNELGKKTNAMKKLNERVWADNSQLTQVSDFAANAIELLRFNESFAAGLPWFQQFWARDVFWSLPALTELGFYREAADSLKLFALNARDGQIPNYVFGKSKTFNSIDSTPLFVIALEHYARWSNDQGTMKKLAPHALNAMQFLESRVDETDGFVVHDQKRKETWMDTLKRKDKAVEVQALYLKALQAFPSLVLAMKNPRKKMRREAGESEMRAIGLRDKLDNAFYSNGFFADRIENGKPVRNRTVNALVPLFLGVSERRAVLKPFNSKEFFTDRGPCTLSRNSPDFSAEGYHTGKVWSLSNGWLAGAEFLLGSEENAWSTIARMCPDFQRDALGCIGECWNPDSLKQTGCLNQLWGNAMITRLIVEFALGVRVDACEKKILVNPKMNGMASRIKLKIKAGAKEGLLEIRPENYSAFISLNNWSVEFL